MASNSLTENQRVDLVGPFVGGHRLEPGDIQFVYNHSLLHDRTAFVDDADPALRRHLLRLWLSLPDDRLLPPVFEQRYGSIEVGDRGGIVVSDMKLTVTFDDS